MSKPRWLTCLLVLLPALALAQSADPPSLSCPSLVITAPAVGQFTVSCLPAPASQPATPATTIPATTLAALTVDKPKVMTSSRPGDAIARIGGISAGSTVTVDNPALVVTKTVLRVAPGGTIAAGPINFTLTEMPATGAPRSTPLSMIGKDPPPGTKFDRSRLGTTVLLNERFNGPPDVWAPKGNPNGKWFDFYPFGEGYFSVGSRTLSYVNMGQGGGNREGEVYSGKEFNGVNPFLPVDGGGVTFEAAATPSAILASMSNLPVTSGFLRRTDPSWTGGLLECRFSMDGGFHLGEWAAPCWMYGAAGKDCIEMDLLEIVGDAADPGPARATHNRGAAKAYQNIHCANGVPSGLTANLDPDFADAYHTIGGYWDNVNLTVMLDGNMTASGVSPPNWQNQQMHVYLDLAVGLDAGAWPGQFDASTLPYHMTIDSVTLTAPAPSAPSKPSPPLLTALPGDGQVSFTIADGYSNPPSTSRKILCGSSPDQVSSVVATGSGLVGGFSGAGEYCKATTTNAQGESDPSPVLAITLNPGLVPQQPGYAGCQVQSPTSVKCLHTSPLSGFSAPNYIWTLKANGDAGPGVSMGDYYNQATFDNLIPGTSYTITVAGVSTSGVVGPAWAVGVTMPTAAPAAPVK